jgi:four helix bundle protein
VAKGFKNLRVWQEAKMLAVAIYKETEDKMKTDFSLKVQMLKAAVSVASNIAEGYERGSDKEFIRFLLLPKGRFLS